MDKFYQRDADGKWANVGWPKYVEGILSATEQAAIEAVSERVFEWEQVRATAPPHPLPPRA